MEDEDRMEIGIGVGMDGGVLTCLLMLTTPEGVREGREHRRLGCTAL